MWERGCSEIIFKSIIYIYLLFYYFLLVYEIVMKELVIQSFMNKYDSWLQKLDYILAKYDN